MDIHNLLDEMGKKKKNLLPIGLFGICILIIGIAGALSCFMWSSSDVDRVVYNTGTSQVYLEKARVPSFCKFVEELESSPVIEEKELDRTLCGYYIYEIQYKDGKKKFVAVNATRLAIDGITHKSSQDICDKFQYFFEDV